MYGLLLLLSCLIYPTMDELNIKGIIHRAGEEEFTETRKLTRSEIKGLDKIANMPMPKKTDYIS